MIKTVKLDGRRAYFCDKNTGEIIYKYDDNNENIKLIINLVDSVLEVNKDKITRQYDKQIVVQHNDDKYIIDDGYSNSLIKAGYIVFDNYDQTLVPPDQKEFGFKLRSDIIRDIRNVIIENQLQYNSIYYNGDKTSLTINLDDDYTYLVEINTTNQIASENKRRKDKSLSYYPYIKNMDKYGTMYLAIFCQKNHHVENNTPSKKYIIPNKFIDDLLRGLNQISTSYHYSACRIAKKVVYCDKKM